MRVLLPKPMMGMRVRSDLVIDSDNRSRMFQTDFEENINYGFHRNIRGLKPIAIILDIIVITILLIWCILFWTGEVLSTDLN